MYSQASTDVASCTIGTWEFWREPSGTGLLGAVLALLCAAISVVWHHYRDVLSELYGEERFLTGGGDIGGRDAPKSALRPGTGRKSGTPTPTSTLNPVFVDKAALKED